MLNICLKKENKFELRVRICVVVASERFERMDILSGQNTEIVKVRYNGLKVGYNGLNGLEVR